MDRILVVVFDSTEAAQRSVPALLTLERDGTLAIYAMAVLTKPVDGGIELGEPAYEHAPSSLMLLRRLAAAFEGAATVQTMGSHAPEAQHLDLDDDFVADVYVTFGPGRSALAAVLDENEVSRLDVGMQLLGGTVLRRALQSPPEAWYPSSTACLDADIGQLSAEYASAPPEYQARLGTAIDALNSKRRRAIDALRFSVRAFEQEIDEKIALLQQKMVTATESARHKHRRRIGGLLRQRRYLNDWYESQAR